MKKLLCVMITTILIFGAASAAYATNNETAVNANFNDLKTTNWAYESVNAMSQKGIVKGYPDGSFKPQGTLTYGEFIKMALIAATKEDVGNSKTGNWALNYYNKALELKYFGETDIKSSQLNKTISRADMALIISNILGETKIDNYSELESSLKDINSTVKNDYDIIKVYAKGIITGYQDSTFKPENTLTRAESATVIYRLVDESKRVIPEEKKEEVKPIETVEKVTIGYASWNNPNKVAPTWEYTLKKAEINDYGIAKFEITNLGYVAIYSTVEYDGIRLVIDNKIITFFGNPNGTNHWEKDGYYVYFAEPAKDGINVKGKVPSIIVDKEVIEFSNVTL